MIKVNYGIDQLYQRVKYTMPDRRAYYALMTLEQVNLQEYKKKNKPEYFQTRKDLLFEQKMLPPHLMEKSMYSDGDLVRYVPTKYDDEIVGMSAIVVSDTKMFHRIQWVWYPVYECLFSDGQVFNIPGCHLRIVQEYENV